METSMMPVRQIKSSVPPGWILHLINPLVSAILRSPLHGVLSESVLLLSFYGRKSGKRFTIPVGYTQEGDVLTVFSTRPWWKNLRGGAIVSIYLRGHRRTVRAEPTKDEAAVVAEVERYLARYGARGASTRIGLTFDVAPPPTRAELAESAHRLTLVRLTLGPSE